MNAAGALEAVAKKYGVSIEEVKREIDLAIESAQNHPNKEAQAFWDSIPREGNMPTPEEVIMFIAKMESRHNGR